MIGSLSASRKKTSAALNGRGIGRLPEPVPVTLLTGFLGSGKTSLLNNLLADPRMAGTAVIVNEFGSVPIDHDLVRAGRETYFRTTTGCICCTATSDVRASLHELHAARLTGEVPPVSRVVIETTGLADPAPIINSLIPGGAPAMGLRDHIVARQFYLSGVVTTFDVIAGPPTLDAHMEGWKQLAFADHIVLTKTDIAQEQVSWADELRGLNPAATVHDRQASGFDLFALLGDRPYSTQDKADDVPGWLAMEGLATRRDHRHERNRQGDKVEAICLSNDTPFDPRSVMTFLELVTSNAGAGLLRLKGILAVADDPERPVVAHAVRHRLFPLQRLDGLPAGDRSTRIVLIGQNMPVQPIRDLFDVLVPRPSSRKRRPA